MSCIACPWSYAYVRLILIIIINYYYYYSWVCSFESTFSNIASLDMHTYIQPKVVHIRILNEIWNVGKDWWLMHGGMPCGYMTWSKVEVKVARRWKLEILTFSKSISPFKNRAGKRLVDSQIYLNLIGHKVRFLVISWNSWMKDPD